MRKFLRIILLLWVVLGFASVSCAEYYNEGNDGNSWETAFVIDSAQDFVEMNGREIEEGGKYYKLAADIDLSEQPDWKGRAFSGHLDGQGHTVIVDMIDGGVLFHNISGTLRNLHVKGYSMSAGIASEVYSGTVENCSFTGTVEAEDESTGGLFAAVENGAVIKNCSFQGNISISLSTI